MSVYYSRLTPRFVSKLDETKDFPSSEAARAFDREFAHRLVADLAGRVVTASVAARDERLVRALRYLADEIESAPFPSETA